MGNSTQESFEKDIATLKGTPVEKSTDHRVTHAGEEGAFLNPEELKRNRDGVVADLKQTLDQITKNSTKLGYTEAYGKGYDEIDWIKKE